jgi:adenylate cyclase
MSQRSGSDAKVRLRTYTLRFILAAAFGTLVFVSVATVLAISVGANFRNTFSLLNQQAITLLNGMEKSIRLETGRAESAVAGLARLYSEGRISLDDPIGLDVVLRALLVAEDKIEGFVIVGRSGVVTGLLRRSDGSITPIPDFKPDENVVARTKASFAAPAARPIWGEPILVGGILYHNVSAQLRRGGEVDGIAIAVLGRATMNSVVAELGQNNETAAFVLDGNDDVIGHSRLTGLFNGRNSLPLETIPDSALTAFRRDASREEEFGEAAAQGIKVYASRGVGGYIYITKELPGYSERPYTLGAYFLKADIGGEVARAFYSLIAGIAGLAAALLGAILLGKRISAPLSRIANTAEKLSDFELEKFEPLPRSRIREIDHQAVALNRMHTAIKEFSKYVPRTLVARLVRSGASAADSVEREVTIMFTDIAGFTTLSERMNAVETAAVLNEHFDIVCSCIEATGGTVDKFLGDGVMAFWGAPEDDAGHAANAVRAARQIAAAIHSSNAARKARHKAPMRLRIGIHSGRVVVGNIGGGGRQNYTLVGDAVNVAQRLEQMGHEIMSPGEEIVVLASASVMAAAGGDAAFLPAGTHVLRGRERPIAIGVLDLKNGRGENVVPFPGKTIPSAG